MAFLCCAPTAITTAVAVGVARRHHRRCAAAVAVAVPRRVSAAASIYARAYASSGRRGDLGVAHAKKKKGFAELLGMGGSAGVAEEAAAVDNKKGASSDADKCPCGGGEAGLPYSRCCKPYHKGEKYPADCVTLMRSRFTGYAKGEGDYIVLTTHPENPILRDGAKAASGAVVSSLAEDVRATCKKVRFYDLEIVSDKPGAPPETEHLVGFRYKCRVVGQKGFKELPEEKHAELSTFRRGEGDVMNGRWLFLDGVTGGDDVLV